MIMTLIGLTGGKGCGKSSVARIMERKFGYEVLSFASPIKEMLRAMGLSDAELNDPTLKEIKLDEYGKSPREMMQLLGTEFARNMIAQDVWITAMKRKLGPGMKVVIDDVRFNNEAEFIRSVGGTILEVKRTKLDHNHDTHVSEAGISEDFIHGTINNISCYETDLELEVVSKIEEVETYGLIYNS